MPLPPNYAWTTKIRKVHFVLKSQHKIILNKSHNTFTIMIQIAYHLVVNKKANISYFIYPYTSHTQNFQMFLTWHISEMEIAKITILTAPHKGILSNNIQQCLLIFWLSIISCLWRNIWIYDLCVKSTGTLYLTSVWRGQELLNGKCRARFHNFISSSDRASKNYASNAFQKSMKVFQNVVSKLQNAVVEWEGRGQLHVICSYSL